MAITQEQYYENNALWGGGQYTKLKDIINNFYAFYVGDDKVIDRAKRYDVVFHAKRALQELHYDALKEINAIEIEVPPTLQMILPKDFVSLVRLSWVDAKGFFHPITINRETAIGVAYLQNDDSTYSYQFDAEGNIEVGTTLTRKRAKEVRLKKDADKEYIKASNDEKTMNRLIRVLSASKPDNMNLDQKETLLYELKGKSPAKFIKVARDKHLELKAEIEEMELTK